MKFFRAIVVAFALYLMLCSYGVADVLDHWHWRNPLPQGNTLRGTTFGNGTFVLVGDAGTLLTSSDGLNWTNRESGTTNALLGATFGDGRFIVVGTNGTIITS